MAAPGASKYIVTAADIGRFLIIIMLGVLAAITFLVAGTVVILMAVDSAACDCFRYFPVGLAVLGILGLIFLVDLIIEAIDAPTVVQEWVTSTTKNQDMLVLGTICLIAFIIVLN
jgi:hypothetical protein